MNLLLGQYKRQSDQHLLNDDWFTTKQLKKALSDSEYCQQDLSFSQEDIEEEHKTVFNDPSISNEQRCPITIANTQDYLDNLEKLDLTLYELNMIINALVVRFKIYGDIKQKLNETKKFLHIFQVQLAIVRELLKNCESSPSEYLIGLQKICELGKEFTVHAQIASQVNQFMSGHLFDYLQQDLLPRMLQLRYYTNGIIRKLHTQLLFDIRVTCSELAILTKIFGSAVDKSCEDLMCFNKQHQRWVKIFQIWTSKQLAEAKQMQKSYDDFAKSIRIGSALIFKRNNFKSQFMRKSIFFLGSVWYFVQSEKTRQRAIAHTSILQPQSAQDVMNLLELSGVKHVMKLGNQLITTNRKIYIESVVNPFTKEYVLKEIRNGTLNNITKMPLQFVNQDIHEDDDRKQDIFQKTSQKVRIRVLCSETLHEPQPDLSHNSDGSGLINRIQSWLGFGQITQKIFDTIIIHIHGGGFISMSSGSHQSYTRQWANKLKVPVFSIDYSLAPKHPYPTALDDCWQAYQWILTYVHKYFNIIPRRIIMAGDSAGANLCCSITGLAIKFGCQIPDGMLLAYPVLDMELKYSPNLLKALKDPVLSHTVLEICGNSYVGSYIPENDPFVSPNNLSDEILKHFPPVRIICGQNDPMLDQSYRFAEKLMYKFMKLSSNNGVDVSMLEYEELSHGFLHFSAMNGMKEAGQCIDDSIDILKSLIHQFD